MAEVKWIKVATDIFDDEKILLIKGMPKADTLLVIWFELLCFAGKQNNSGVFLMNNKTPFTYKMLATIFKRNEKIIKDALNIFSQFGMIEIVDDVITIPNWNKHQTLDSYEKKKERDKKYQAERRAVQKSIIAKKSSDESSDKSPDVAISDKEREEEKEEDIIYRERGKINNNNPAREETNPEPSPMAYGEFKNVFLSDDELSKLKKSFPDWPDKIERLSSYIESTGKSYVSHYATITRWAKEDAAKAKKPVHSRTRFNNYTGDENLSDFEKNEISKRMKT